MFPYLVRRIANYALLLFIATSLAYLLASASLDPANNWNREDPTLNWDAINASLIEYNISSELPVWDRYLSWFHSVALSWDWGSTPKGEAPIAEAPGRLKVEDGERTRRLIVVRDDGDEDLVYQVSKRAKLLVSEDSRVQVGQQLVEGSVDPKKVLRISGRRSAQEHIVSEVQSVYRSQGVEIHDKHIEVIVRQMLRRVTILEAGTTKLLPGELVDVAIFEDENRTAMAEGGKPASGRPELMGITKASLATDSWLSAASFQETTKVLTEAALNAKSDPLSGLKENVILGKLIPAGTGLEQLRNVRVEPTSEARIEFEKNNGFSHRDLEAFDDGFGYGDFPDFDLSAGYPAF